ncbi:hypothetical protein BD414DRAFT_102471 [Trametes punicea]|nr:hypothetical protein BD414DRAFT_102471 [Trametes punicea]
MTSSLVVHKSRSFELVSSARMVFVSRNALAVVPITALLAHAARPVLARTTVSLPALCSIPTQSRALSFAMSDSSSTGPARPAPSTPEFLQDRLSTLLASPHIHFNHPPALGGIRLGHGPVDLFSTRFMNYFTPDATGVVAGKQVDHEGLKNALLALQKKWDGQNANFVAQEAAAKPTTRLLWAQRGTGTQADVTAAAEVKEHEGAPKISHLVLDGDESLFSA